MLSAIQLLVLCLCCPEAQAEAERELIRDSHFQNGFILLAPAPGQRVPYGTFPGLANAPEPVWDLAQWSSLHPLSKDSRPLSLENGLRYTNSAKSVTLGKPGAGYGDVALAVMGSAEYGRRVRKSGEPWVHLLLQQSIENPPALAELARAQFHVEARLLSSRKIDAPGYTPDLHAAQFQVFFSVQNRNRQSPGYGQYLWFGIPLYDNRHRVPAAYMAQDFGGTKMFIFTPPGDAFTSQSAHDMAWIIIDRDLLPLMRQGLETAWRQGFLKDSQALADYRIAEMNLGWEVPGIFDVEMQLRNLSLKRIGR